MMRMICSRSNNRTEDRAKREKQFVCTNIKVQNQNKDNDNFYIFRWVNISRTYPGEYVAS